MKKLPILVTLEAAEAYKEAAIAYAAKRTAAYFCLFVLCLFIPFTFILLLDESSHFGYYFPALLLCPILGGASYYLLNNSDYPHCPRISSDELEFIREEMGLPLSVIQEMEDSVIHSTKSENEARELVKKMLSKW